MLHHHSHKARGSSSRIAAILTLAAAGALAGCSLWDLGPEPDNYVGASRNGARSLTDPALEAVTPQAHGEQDIYGATSAAGGAAAATMAASQPAGSQPASSQPVATSGPASQPATSTSVPETLSVQDAILIGMQNNVNLRVERYTVPKARTGEETALSAFDPTVNYSIQGQRTQSVTPQSIIHVDTTSGTTTTTIINGIGTVDSINANANITEVLPTGTTVVVGANTANSFFSENSDSIGGSVSVTQSLLRGGSLKANLAQLREAELATKISQYQLRGVAESLVASIEEAYWNLAYAERNVTILENALKVAQDQLDSTNASIRVGRVAETERAAAQAQVETEKEDLIDAKSALETARLTLLQLLTPSSRSFWDRSIALTTYPFIPKGTMDPVEAHAAVALRMSPAINEAKLQLQSGQLEVVRTKNGLLPRLDLFVQLGKSSLATTFGNSITTLNGPGYNAILGVQGDWEPINRAATASYRSAELSKDQLQETLDNQAQQVELDVRTKYIEVERTREQIDATRATRESQETSLKVEQAKFQQGRSTSLLVAGVQQLLLAAQVAEVQAVTNHLNALGGALPGGRIAALSPRNRRPGRRAGERPRLAEVREGETKKPTPLRDFFPLYFSFYIRPPFLITSSQATTSP